MLTFRLRHGAAATLFVLALASHAPAQADWTGTTSCVGTRGMGSCVSNFRVFPRDSHVRPVRGYDSYSDSEEAIERNRKELIARDQKWLAFCKPALAADRYGVERYLYAKPGCEFGRSE